MPDPSHPERPRCFKRLALLGVGLMGGCFARDLRAIDGVDEIVGCSRTTEPLSKALDADKKPEQEDNNRDQPGNGPWRVLGARLACE